MESTRRHATSMLLLLLMEGSVVFGNDPTVTLPVGTLFGKTVTFHEDKFINVTKQIDAFLGVPYAEPALRFEKPRAKEAWSDIWNATSFKSSCYQFVDSNSYIPEPSEDCLYLNIYAPNPKLPELAPVMVWIHGGGFQSDTAMSYDYYGVPLVAVGDVIVVTVNYRLSIFARFSTGDEEARGNFGMLDQVAALQWVHENIQAFGGDADRVTLFGESAGSAAVGFHLLSPMSRDLFQQAIMQSGTAASRWAFELNPENDWQKAEALGLEMGCDTPSSSILIACLRETDADDLMTAASTIYSPGGSYQLTLDGTFMQDTPLNLYNRGEFAHLPILIGFNEDEGTIAVFSSSSSFIGTPEPPYISREVFENFVPSVTRFYGDDDDDILKDTIMQEYTDWTMFDRSDADYFRSFVDLFGDVSFGCPTDFVVRRHADVDSPVYKYLMTHGPSATSFFGENGDAVKFTPWLEASHGEDVIFVFGLPFIDELADIHGHNLTDEEKMMSVQTMTYWTNFAKTGDPNMGSTDRPSQQEYDSWPLFTIPELRYKELSLEFENGRAVRASQCHLLNDYLPTLAALAGNPEDDQEKWEEGYASWQNDLTLWRNEFKEYQENGPCNE